MNWPSTSLSSAVASAVASLLASGRSLAGGEDGLGFDDDPAPDPVDRFAEAWGQGGPPPDLDRFHDGLGPEADVETLKRLVKLDMQRRFDLGERPTARDYLARYAALREAGEPAISVIYAEYCLREAAGEPPDTAEFCAGYGPWRDSLQAQLQIHRALSQAAALPAPRFPEVGETFLGFRLGKVLGQGGAGRVYHAFEEELGDREVALKISADRGPEPRILGPLRHPHIMKVLGTRRDEQTGLRALSMPYLRGLSLDKVIEKLGPVPSPPAREGKRRAVGRPRARPQPALAFWEAVAPEGPARPDWAGFPDRGRRADGAAWIALCLARALAHVHTHVKQILHGDIKPANVLLSAERGPLLIDFNLAQARNLPAEVGAEARGGTLPYMAPEQLRAFHDEALWAAVGPQADVYSLGLVLAEMLTGRPPSTPERLRSMQPAEAIRELLEARAARPPIRTGDPGVPAGLRAIVGLCLEPDPARRYPDASALAEDLARFLDRRPLLHARNPSRRERAANRLRRARGPLAAVALAAALVPVIMAFRGGGTPPARPPAGPVTITATPEARANAVELAIGRVGSLETSAATDPDKLRALREDLREALDHAFGGDPAAVADALRTAAGDDDRVIARVAGLALALGRLDADEWGEQATRAAEVASRVDPENREVLYSLGGFLQMRGRFADARSRLDAAIALGPPRGGDDAAVYFRTFLTRGRVLIAWAESLAGAERPGPEEFAAAHRMLDQARLDLRTYKLWKGPADGDAKDTQGYAHDYARALAEAVRGALAWRAAEGPAPPYLLDLADAHYRAAAGWLPGPIRYEQSRKGVDPETLHAHRLLRDLRGRRDELFRSPAPAPADATTTASR